MTKAKCEQVARKLEEKLDDLRREFGEVLARHKITGVEVVSFSVTPVEDRVRALTFDGSPCPTKCRLLPNGQIECKPVC